MVIILICIMLYSIVSLLVNLDKIHNTIEEMKIHIEILESKINKSNNQIGDPNVNHNNK